MDKEVLQNIDIYIYIDKAILKNRDINKAILKNVCINIDKGIIKILIR